MQLESAASLSSWQDVAGRAVGNQVTDDALVRYQTGSLGNVDVATVLATQVTTPNRMGQLNTCCQCLP